jgi:hypothetical protein
MKFNGSSWVTVGTAGFSTGTANYIDLLIKSGGTAFVAYSDSFFSNRPFVQYFNGSSWVSVATGLPTGAADFTSLAISGSMLYFAYQEGSSTFEANVMKYDLASGINENSNELTSNVYPNPVIANAVIEWGTMLNDAELNVTDIAGRILLNTKISGDKFLLERGELKEGAYFYTITEKNKAVSAGKFIIAD